MRVEEYRASVSEADVQRDVIEALEWHCCRVIVTSRQRRKCEECGHVNRKKGDGVTRGCPDLIIHHCSWPEDVWVGYEIKGPKTPVSPEQRELAEAGHTYIIRTVDEALAILDRCNRRWARKAVEG